MRVYYAKAVYDKKEINAVSKVLKNPTALMNGPSVKEFEKKASKLFGKKYGLMVNSGSSANLLAISAFNFKKGSEIITPSLTFATTVAPIYQANCVPYFIDVLDRQFIANVDQIEKCITKKTVAIMIPNLLGNIANWNIIFKLAKKYNLKVIEDSADTLGYKYNNNNTGKLSDAVSTSFYGAHLITGAGFGGIVCFNDKNFMKTLKCLESTEGHQLYLIKTLVSNLDLKKIDGIQYDVKYIFADMGYNFIPSEISAAFGLEQLKKLKHIINKRIKIFNLLNRFFSNYPNFFRTPIQQNKTKTGWLAYPILLKNTHHFQEASSK